MTLVLPVWADVLLLAPELAAVTDTARQAAILNAVAIRVVAPEWGSRSKLAATWLAAHLATLTSRGGSVAGPLASKTVGPISLSYMVTATTDESLGSTVYGREYRAMAKNTPKFRGLMVV